MKINFSEDRFYDDDYSWILLDEASGTAIVGIIQPAADLVKEFVFIQLPDKNKHLKKGEVYVSLESVKWSGHIKSPLTGKVLDVNESLFNSPSRINRDAYGSWIIKLKIENPEELESLFSSSEKENLIKKPFNKQNK